MPHADNIGELCSTDVAIAKHFSKFGSDSKLCSGLYIAVRGIRTYSITNKSKAYL